MAGFSNVEYADILFMYGKADANAAAAQRLYRERFPNRRVPNVQVFINTYRRIRETGNLHRAEQHPGAGRYNVADEEQILEAFEADPTVSIRTIARQLNLSLWKVWSVLRMEGKHPFHYTPVQGLEEGDPVRRMTFCRFLLNADMEDRLFLKSILWSDESRFNRDGITNFHNLHYWADADENPHAKKQVSFQHRFGVNVWAAVIGRTFIGPFYLPDNLNGDNYLEFLQNDLPNILDDIPLNVRENIIFQNDGCPAHFRLAVREFLDQTFPNRWIGRNGPILWPARSPDLTPLDFHVWGRMKDLVYEVEIVNREQLIQRINEAAERLRVEIRFAVTTTQIRKRARKCCQNQGGHFEHQM